MLSAVGLGRREAQKKPPALARGASCLLEQLHSVGVAHHVAQRVGATRAGSNFADRVLHEPVA